MPQAAVTFQMTTVLGSAAKAAHFVHCSRQTAPCIASHLPIRVSHVAGNVPSRCRLGPAGPARPAPRQPSIATAAAATSAAVPGDSYNDSLLSTARRRLSGLLWSTHDREIWSVALPALVAMLLEPFMNAFNAGATRAHCLACKRHPLPTLLLRWGTGVVLEVQAGGAFAHPGSGCQVHRVPGRTAPGCVPPRLSLPCIPSTATSRLTPYATHPPVGPPLLPCSPTPLTPTTTTTSLLCPLPPPPPPRPGGAPGHAAAERRVAGQPGGVVLHLPVLLPALPDRAGDCGGGGQEGPRPGVGLGAWAGRLAGGWASRLCHWVLPMLLLLVGVGGLSVSVPV